MRTVVDAALDQTELRPHRAKLTKYLSGGMKRKLCLAIALIGDPQIVLLDEPTAGLDPVSRHTLWDLIVATMGERAVVLTSHNMAEVEALCTKIGIMTKGQLRCFGSNVQLKEQLCSGYELTVRCGAADERAVRAAVARLFGDAICTAAHAGELVFALGDALELGEAYRALDAVQAELGVEEYGITQPTMEAVFMKAVSVLEDATEADDARGVEVLAGNPMLGGDGDDVFDVVLAGDGFADEALQQKYGFEEPKCCCMSKLAHKIMCHYSLWSGCGCQFLCWHCFPFWWPVTALYAFFLSFYWCVHAFGRCCVSVCNKEA